ncbi:MAG: hypothetical protein KA210_03005 [Bacteroidia bacterium]|nr:hypothetical protein [Bacteroidia bacterium]
MTLVIATIFRNSIHIVADSVVTTDIDESNESVVEYTSFGELNTQNDENIVLERVNKIELINDNILFSFAGSEREGIEHYKKISDLLIGKNKSDVGDIIEKYYSINVFKECEIVLAYIDISPYLFCLNKHEIKLFSDDKSMVVLGSGSEDNNLMSQILATLFNTADRVRTFDEYLVLLVSVCQSSCTNSYSIKYGVGGFFNGAYVKYDSIKWADDTVYFLYSSNNFENERFIIEKFNRNNTVYINSFKGLNCFHSNYNMNYYKSEEELLKVWNDELVYLSNDFTFKYLVFISFDYRNVTVLNSEKPDFNQKFIFIDRSIIDGQEIIQLKISDAIMNLLTQRMNSPNDDLSDGYGISINYC